MGALTIAACDGRPTDKTATGARTPQGESAGGMMGMQGLEMMSTMRAHMDSVSHMSPEELRAMMPQHDAMMSRMDGRDGVRHAGHADGGRRGLECARGFREARPRGPAESLG